MSQPGLKRKFNSQFMKGCREKLPTTKLDVNMTHEECESLNVAYTCVDNINSVNIIDRCGYDNFEKLKNKLSFIENKLFELLEFYELSHMFITFDYMKPASLNKNDYWGDMNILFSNVSLFTKGTSKLVNSINCEQLHFPFQPHLQINTYLARNLQTFCRTKKRKGLRESVLVSDMFYMTQDFMKIASWPALVRNVERMNPTSRIRCKRVESYGALLWDVTEKKIYMKSFDTLTDGKKTVEL